MEGNGVTIMDLVRTQCALAIVVREASIRRLEDILVEIVSTEKIVLGS